MDLQLTYGTQQSWSVAFSSTSVCIELISTVVHFPLGQAPFYFIFIFIFKERKGKSLLTNNYLSLHLIAFGSLVEFSEIYLLASEKVREGLFLLGSLYIYLPFERC